MGRNKDPYHLHLPISLLRNSFKKDANKLLSTHYFIAGNPIEANVLIFFFFKDRCHMGMACKKILATEPGQQLLYFVIF